MDLFKGIGDFVGGLFGQKKKREENQPQIQPQPKPQPKVNFNTSTQLGGDVVKFGGEQEQQKPKTFGVSADSFGMSKPAGILAQNNKPEVKPAQPKMEVKNPYNQEHANLNKGVGRGVYKPEVLQTFDQKETERKKAENFVKQQQASDNLLKGAEIAGGRTFYGNRRMGNGEHVYDWQKRYNKHVEDTVSREQAEWERTRGSVDKIFGLNNFDKERSIANAKASFLSNPNNINYDNPREVEMAQKQSAVARKITDDVASNYKRTTGYGGFEGLFANSMADNAYGKISRGISKLNNDKTDAEHYAYLNKMLEDGQMTPEEAEQYRKNHNLANIMGYDHILDPETGRYRERNFLEQKRKELEDWTGLAKDSVGLSTNSVRAGLDILTGENDKKNALGHTVNFVGNLPVGMVSGLAETPEMVVNGYSQIGDGIYHGDIGEVVGGVAKLGESTINVTGLNVGGSGTLLKSLKMNLGKQTTKQGTKEVAKTGIKQVFKSLGKDISGEALEEATQNFLSQLSANNGDMSKVDWGQITESAVLGGVGGGVMGGVGLGVNNLRKVDNPYKATEQTQPHTGDRDTGNFGGRDFRGENGAAYKINPQTGVVEIENDILRGVKPEDRRQAIKNFFQNNLQGNNYELNHGLDGEALINARSRNKYLDPNQTIDDLIIKGRMTGELPDILKVSQKIGQAKDSKSHSFAKDGFEYRKSTVKIGDDFYNVRLNVGINGDNKLFYTINGIEKIPTSASVNDSRTEFKFGDFHGSNISQNPHNVNNPYTSKSSYNPEELLRLENQQRDFGKSGDEDLENIYSQENMEKLWKNRKNQIDINKINPKQWGYNLDEMVGKIKGDTRKRMSERSFKKLQELRENNPYTTQDGSEIYLTNRGNKKYISTKTPETEVEFELKQRLAPHIRDVVAKSSFAGFRNDLKNHNNATGGFDYRETPIRFKDNNYTATLNIAKNGETGVNSVYGANVKENTAPLTGSPNGSPVDSGVFRNESPRSPEEYTLSGRGGSSLSGERDFSDLSVSQNPHNVNNPYDENVRYKAQAEANQLTAKIDDLKTRHQNLTGDEDLVFNMYRNEIEKRASGYFDSKTGKINLNQLTDDVLNHEIGHKIFSRVNAEQKADLLNEVKSVYGAEDLLNRYDKAYAEQTKNMTLEQKLDLFAEERLADGFSEYFNGKLNGEDGVRLGQRLGIPPKVLAYYDRLVEAIKSVFGKTDELRKFYAEIETGKYAREYQNATTGAVSNTPVFKIDPERALNTLKNFKDVLQGDKNTVKLTSVSQELSERIYNATGIKVNTGANYELSKPNAIHISNRHIYNKADTNPLTDVDVASLPYVLENPDVIKKGNFTRYGDRIRLERRVNNDHIAVVEVIKKGNALNVVTYFNDSSSTPPNATNSPVDIRPRREQSTNLDGIIPQNSEKFKPYEINDIRKEGLKDSQSAVFGSSPSYGYNISQDGENVKYKAAFPKVQDSELDSDMLKPYGLKYTKTDFNQALDSALWELNPELAQKYEMAQHMVEGLEDNIEFNQFTPSQLENIFGKNYSEFIDKGVISQMIRKDARIGLDQAAMKSDTSEVDVEDYVDRLNSYFEAKRNLKAIEQEVREAYADPELRENAKATAEITAMEQAEAELGVEELQRREAEYQDKKIGIVTGLRNKPSNDKIITADELPQPKRKFDQIAEKYADQVGELTDYEKRRMSEAIAKGKRQGIVKDLKTEPTPSVYKMTKDI